MTIVYSGFAQFNKRSGLSDKETVYIIDDDPGVRDSLTLLLGLHGLRVQTFSEASSFLSANPTCNSCCALVDIRLGEMGGLELQKTLKLRDMAIPIIFMTGHPNVATSRVAFKAGAVDYLVKPLSEVELLLAIEQAFSVGMMTTGVQLPESAMLLVQQLAQRERQILMLLVDGLSSREIAGRLTISHRTVETYKARMMKKLNLHKLSELVRVGVLSMQHYSLP